MDKGKTAEDWDVLYEHYCALGYSDEAAAELANQGYFDICTICAKEVGGCEHTSEED